MSLSDERKKIVRFAELDEERWKELMDEIEKQDKQFIKALHKGMLQVVKNF